MSTMCLKASPVGPKTVRRGNYGTGCLAQMHHFCDGCMSCPGPVSEVLMWRSLAGWCCSPTPTSMPAP